MAEARRRQTYVDSIGRKEEASWLEYFVCIRVNIENELASNTCKCRLGCLEVKLLIEVYGRWHNLCGRSYCKRFQLGVRELCVMM